MGIYDTYAGVQLKVGDPTMETYSMGDKVPIPDGLYVGHEGIIVVCLGHLVDKHDFIIAKWGDKIMAQTIVDSISPLGRLLATGVAAAPLVHYDVEDLAKMTNAIASVIPLPEDGATLHMTLLQVKRLLEILMSRLERDGYVRIEERAYNA